MWSVPPKQNVLSKGQTRFNLNVVANELTVADAWPRRHISNPRIALIQSHIFRQGPEVRMGLTKWLVSNSRTTQGSTRIMHASKGLLARVLAKSKVKEQSDVDVLGLVFDLMNAATAELPQ
jgi:hypothetical protein